MGIINTAIIPITFWILFISYNLFHGIDGISDGFIYLNEASDIIFDHTHFINETYWNEGFDYFDYINDFEDYEQLRGWAWYDGTDCHNGPSHSSGCYEGNCIRLGGDCSTTSYDTYYVSPEYIITEDSPVLNFWDRTDYRNSNDYDHYIYVRRNGDQGWSTLDSWGSENTTWTERTYNLDSWYNFSPGDRVQFRFRLYFYDWMYWYIDNFSLDGAVKSGYINWGEDFQGQLGTDPFPQGYPGNAMVSHEGDGDMTITTSTSHSSPSSIRTYYDGGDNNYYEDIVTLPDFSVSGFADGNYDGSVVVFWNYRTDWYSNGEDEFCMEWSVNDGSWVERWCDGDDETGWRGIEWGSDSYTEPNDKINIRFRHRYQRWGYMDLDDILITGVKTLGGQKEAAIYSINSENIQITNSTFSNSPGINVIKTRGNNCIDLTGSNIDASHQKYALYMLEEMDDECTIILDGTTITSAREDNIRLEDGNKALSISNSSLISDAGEYGIYTYGYNSGVDMEYSTIAGNGQAGIDVDQNSHITVEYSLIIDNNEYGIQADSDLDMNHSIIVDNGNYGIDVNSSRFSSVNNSIFWGNGYDGNSNRQVDSDYGQLSYSVIQGVEGYGTSGNLDFLDCTLLQPLLNDDYSLGEFSSAIDKAAPYEHDALMPPGLGTVRADAGIFGGSGNDYWGGEEIPDGAPSIVNISDIPQDQGGWVGIQYNGSIFDHSHSGYDIGHYSFWRLMDLEGRDGVDASHTPDAEYLNLGRDEYWEHVGEMTSQGFESYGYSAPTLGNTVDSVMFISTFIVIAHTPDDDIFFISDEASGYSVDNIAPPAPGELYHSMQGADLLLSWNASSAADFLYFTIYRNNEAISTQEYPQYLDDSMPYGSEVNYQITATDEHNNTSELSELYNTYVNVLGDVNADYMLNVMDLILIVDCILDGADCGFDTVQMTIADIDDNGVIDILDLVQLIGIVLNNNSRVISDITETNVYKYSDRLTHSGSGIIGYEITISHEPRMQINLTKDAFVADMVTDNNESRIIILNPESELLFTSDGDFEIIEITSASTSNYIDVILTLIPDSFEVSAAYPNPFNPNTTIKYGLPAQVQVTVSIYDVSGRLIENLVDGVMDAGYHSHVWDASQLSSGVYFVNVQTSFGINTQKIMLMK